MNKRRWFQFHLSTAVLLTITAGLLLRAEFVKVPKNYWRYGAFRTVNGVQDTVADDQGWPWSFTSFWSNESIKYDVLVADILCGLAILIVVGAFAEWLIRRRELLKN